LSAIPLSIILQSLLHHATAYCNFNGFCVSRSLIATIDGRYRHAEAKSGAGGTSFAAPVFILSQEESMASNARSPLTTWIVIAVIGIIVLLFAGLLPLPGQKDNVTPNTQPSSPGSSPQAQAPKGPPPSPPSEPGAGTQPPPGGTPSTSPGSATSNTSSQTMTGTAPQRDPK
jgi:hypothetical protein